MVQAPEAGRGRRQQLGQALGEQGLQSLPQAGVVAFQFPVVLLLVGPDQGLVFPQCILTPEGQMTGDAQGLALREKARLMGGESLRGGHEL